MCIGCSRGKERARYVSAEECVGRREEEKGKNNRSGLGAARKQGES